MDRINVVKAWVISIFIFLSLGLINLELLQGRKYKDLSDKNSIRLLPRLGARGNILDREGRIIVGNKLSYDLMLMPGELRQQEKVLNSVSKILEVSAQELKDSLKRGYVSESTLVLLKKNISVNKAIILEEQKRDLSGIIIQPNPRRYYPYSILACHLIGYIDEIDRWRLTKLADYGYKKKDIVGFMGIEEKYDYYLRQEAGGLSVEIDHRGRLVRTLGVRPPANGTDIQLTLNLKIQQIVEEALQGRSGSVVIMDPNNGEILALASHPGFNPAVFLEKRNSGITGLLKDPNSPFLNRATSATYPAGSVFKIVVAAAALETKKITPASSFFCAGKTFIGKEEFSCWSTHLNQNLTSAIAHSCNVFFYHTGLLIGSQVIYEYALKFGLAKPTGFELPYEAGGFIPSLLWRKLNKFKKWFDGDTANLSIGQGEVLVTPLQMARMIAVFANKGYLVTPYIVKTIGRRDISAKQRKEIPVHLKESTIDSINRGLREVVLGSAGTGNILSDLPVEVAGKTGTAQAPPAEPHAWFAGFFPFKNPRFAICVFLERGGSGYQACVAAKQIIAAMINEGLI
jgi:penicillin-binding protein 2